MCVESCKPQSDKQIRISSKRDVYGVCRPPKRRHSMKLVQVCRSQKRRAGRDVCSIVVASHGSDKLETICSNLTRQRSRIYLCRKDCPEFVSCVTDSSRNCSNLLRATGATSKRELFRERLFEICKDFRGLIRKCVASHRSDKRVTPVSRGFIGSAKTVGGDPSELCCEPQARRAGEDLFGIADHRATGRRRSVRSVQATEATCVLTSGLRVENGL